MNAAYKNILKVTTLFGGVQGLNILLNLLRTKFVAILLGPEGVGLNSIYNETRELVHSTTNLGLDVSGVRGISQAFEQYTIADDTEKYYYWTKVCEQVTLLRSWVLLLSLFGMLTCIVLSTPLSLFTFGDYTHVWQFVILSPAVAFSTITCGEMAVMKGLRSIKSLAKVSVINVVFALITTIPIYYFLGIDGVLPGLLAFTFATMLITLTFGFKEHPLSLAFSRKKLTAGKLMLGIGTVVVVTEGISHLVILGIQSYLNNVASLHAVGLYNAAYTMTMTYAGMVFASMATDYFPRLTGVIRDKVLRTETVIRQIEVNIMLTVPMLMLFIILLPYLVPLLLDSKFNDIVPMTQIVAVGLFFRAIMLPNNYMPLAAGDSRVYFLLNLVGALDMIAVIPGYMYGGLIGAGIALTLQNLLDMLLSLVVARIIYKTRFSRRVIIGTVGGTLLLLSTYFIVSI